MLKLTKYIGKRIIVRPIGGTLARAQAGKEFEAYVGYIKSTIRYDYLPCIFSNIKYQHMSIPKHISYKSAICYGQRGISNGLELIKVID